MKSVEGKTWATPSSGAEENVQIPALEILKASMQIKTSKGMGYILSFLRGTDKENWLSDAHRALSSYRSMSHYGRDLMNRTFHFLVDEGLMAPLNSGYAAFHVTDAGRDFVQNPTGVWLQKAYLTLTKGETYYYARLRTFRKNTAESLRMKEFDIFSEYTLDRLVMRMPNTVDALMEVPGMNMFRLELFGAALLEFMQGLPANLREVQQRRIDYWNSMPDHRYIRMRVLEDRNLQNIADMIGYDLVKVERILQDLHSDEDMNLRAWIENQVSAKTLYKGADYFRKASDQSLGTAQKALGLDMPTLVLSRLYIYISTFAAYQEPLEFVKKAG